MSTKYSQKLEKLRQRRKPTDLAKSLTASMTFDSARSDSLVESFEVQGKGVATKYALGCMAEVPPEYTAISLRDGQRISDQLTSQSTLKVSTKLQGSVPLNIHIYTSSDVDLLVFADWFISVDNPVLVPTKYDFNPSISPVNELSRLRKFCEEYLDARYPAAEVDITGAKSIAVSGGSLARKVDVVPAHWIDSVEYQNTSFDHTRDVAILNKHERTTLRNRPFMHMASIEAKDRTSSGYAKRAIRLLKCLSRDADMKIKLSSYDIAGLIYHMSDAELIGQQYFPLLLLDRVEAYLRRLEANPHVAFSLNTPDGTRKVLDSAEKFTSLIQLRRELTDAIDNIATEYNTALAFTVDRSKAAELARKTLRETAIY
ncbi:hypothetical protein WI80_14615 [Burkholderia ubonensis]|uniref:hypothetical protein n=1 Tax=Burkholderia ubonensis TaxID=101571 RepID=UPI0007561B79|nr:hypothetical protein [Burkholderia ubonensis]KVD08039.1 hypothetical protein WI80_14615 [Burkholderia ubonensis]KVU19294.1 hypothetical protein WK63_06630 [Burkholderia ubonensis]